MGVITISPAHTCSPQNRSPCCGSRCPHSYQSCSQGRWAKPSAETVEPKLTVLWNPQAPDNSDAVRGNSQGWFFPAPGEKRPSATFFTQKPQGLAGRSEG